MFRFSVRVQFSGQRWCVVRTRVVEAPSTTQCEYRSTNAMYSFRLLNDQGDLLYYGDMPDSDGVEGIRDLEFILPQGRYRLKISRLIGWSWCEQAELSIVDPLLEESLPPVETGSDCVFTQPVSERPAIPCFGPLKRTSYQKGVRVGPLDGFKTFSVMVSQRCYVLVNNGSVIDDRAPKPQKEFPTFFPDGRWLEIGE
jgi:hypothetical protein